MALVDLAAIITVCVTLFLGILGFIINTYLQKKNNSVKIITQFRVSRLKDTEELGANILARTDKDYFNTLDNLELENNIRELIQDISLMRTMYHNYFKYDCELLNSAYELKQKYCNHDRNWDEINKARTKFERNIDIYCTTDWKRIKKETAGEINCKSNRHNEWEEEYFKNVAGFDNTENKIKINSEN